MKAKDEKTNVMRVLDSKKIKYQHYYYGDTDAISGTDAAPKAASSSGNLSPTASPLAPLATLRPPLRAMRARCSARYCNPRS